jgi:transposase
MVEQHHLSEVPPETDRVAKAVLPKRDEYLILCAALSSVFHDDRFAELFNYTEDPTMAPGFLALVTIIQFVEKRDDWAVQQDIRGRIDLKYFLGISLEESAEFDSTHLRAFRNGLTQDSVTRQLLEAIVAAAAKTEMIRLRGKQRIDVAQVLATVQQLNRYRLIYDVLHQTLDALQQVSPDWAHQQLPFAWRVRYIEPAHPFALPRSASALKAEVELMGTDGQQLLQWIDQSENAALWNELPAVQVLRMVWTQEFETRRGQCRWRS